jgi:glycosyltransferase involved in cell wall biosynthesis
MKPNFSCVMIARNEEKTLPRMLKSLEQFRDAGGDVTLVDTGSIDKTVSIAKDWGCSVFEAGKSIQI